MAEAMEIDEVTSDKNSNSKYADTMQSNLSPKQQKRLDALLKQAELFAHFIGNSPKQAAKRNKMARKEEKKSPSSNERRHNRSMEQEDEDNEDDDETTTGVRFETTPSYIIGEMRDYQLRGLNWLISLHENGMNGILADEMGLGKTLQTISMLGFLKNYKSINGAFLVVGPKSTLGNWKNEVNRFSPTLRVLILIGEKTARQEVIHQLEHRKSWDVLLTTYEMILAEKSALKRYHWRYLVVDEAHRLKNENNKISTILRSFKSDNRLLLTGTPLQNNLHELWALLNFILPDVFASADDFDTWFDSDDCLRGNHDIVQRLRAILKPCMLRRMKAEVEKSLLPKIELKLFIKLTPLQHETYKTVLLKEVKKIDAFGQQSTKAIHMILQELRKAANHPYLIDNIEPGPPYTTDMHLITSCGKMLYLDKLLANLKSKGSRVVLFSQFTMMLDIIEDYLVWRGYEYRRLDGQTPYEQRAESIDQFNAENSNIFVFIISTKAGGLGINLATADTVIIYDSDWNPQSDFQAIDRVHRIGQKKQVKIFRLITENTIDQRIVERAEIKHRLDKMVIQRGKATDKNLNELTKGNKRDMILYGADYILSSDGNDVVDVNIDIENVLKEAEIKTAEENEKYSKLGENELRNMTLEEASSVSVYQFEGVDFRGMQNQTKENGKFMLRQRKAVQYVMPPVFSTPVVLRKMKYLNDHHFYPKRLHDMSENRDGWIDMAVDTELKKNLLAEGFPNWSRSDLRTFVNAMKTYGRDDLKGIASMLPEKKFNEIVRYHRAFWSRGKTELKEFDRYVASLLKAQIEQNKQKSISEAFHWKMTSYRCPELELMVKGSKNLYTCEQIRFILCYLFEIGIDAPNVYSRIHEKILSNRRHNFDFFLRSRTAAELKEQTKYLLNLINREYFETTSKNTSASSDNTETTGNKYATIGGKKRVLQDKMNMNVTVG